MHLAPITLDDRSLTSLHLLTDLSNEDSVNRTRVLSFPVNRREAERIEFKAEAPRIAAAQSLSHELARAIEQRRGLQAGADISSVFRDRILHRCAIDSDR